MEQEAVPIQPPVEEEGQEHGPVAGLRQMDQHSEGYHKRDLTYVWRVQVLAHIGMLGALARVELCPQEASWRHTLQGEG